MSEIVEYEINLLHKIPGKRRFEMLEASVRLVAKTTADEITDNGKFLEAWRRLRRHAKVMLLEADYDISTVGDKHPAGQPTKKIGDTT